MEQKTILWERLHKYPQLVSLWSPKTKVWFSLLVMANLPATFISSYMAS